MSDAEAVVIAAERTRKLAEAVSADHFGVRLRITHDPSGVLLDADSDRLYFIARFGGGDGEARWYEIFPGDGMTFAGSRALVIEIQAVKLGAYPDY